MCDSRARYVPCALFSFVFFVALMCDIYLFIMKTNLCYFFRKLSGEARSAIAEYLTVLKVNLHLLRFFFLDVLLLPLIY